MQDFEGLGTFYLGARYDLERRERRRDELVLYDPKDLVTHALCVGMTGSGKTGLLFVMVEEALRSNIPVLMIDVKGDLPNLLLSFPSFSPKEIEPWAVDGPESQRSPAELAAQVADERRKGLEAWSIGESELADPPHPKTRP